MAAAARAARERQAQQQKNQVTNVRAVARERALATMDKFKDELQNFGVRYREELNVKGHNEWQSPEFRRNFLQLFKKVGVDPLSSSKNVWSQALGTGLVQFYADLAVAAAGVCMATRPLNGGLIPLLELTERLRRKGSASGGSSTASSSDVTEDDVLAALGKLSVLGGGYTCVELGGVKYVRSVPEDLETDGASLLALASKMQSYATTVDGAVRTLGWSEIRVTAALFGLVRESMAWIDTQGEATTFFFPSLMNLS